MVARFVRSWRMGKIGPSAKLAVLFFLFLSANAAAAKAIIQPLPIGDLITMRHLDPRSGAQFSPDGKYVAYGVSEAGGLGPSSIWLRDLERGITREITDPNARSWAPIWSPDGQSIAFYSDKDGATHLWLWDRRSGIRKISDALIAPTSVSQWTSDGRSVIASVKSVNVQDGAAPAAVREAPSGTLFVAGLTPEARRAAGIPDEVVDRSNRPSHDLAKIDLQNGHFHRLLQQIRFVQAVLSPQGTHVAFSVIVQPRADAYDYLYDLRVMSLANGRTRTVAHAVALDSQVASFTWSPDGRSLAFNTIVSLPNALNPFKDRMNMFVTSADGKDGPRNITPPGIFLRGESTPRWAPDGNSILCAGYSLGEGAGDGTTTSAVWRLFPDDVARSRTVANFVNGSVLAILSSNHRNTAWSPDDGRSVAFIARDRTNQREGIYSLDLQSETVTPIFEGDNSIGTVGTLDGHDSIVLSIEAAGAPQDLWVVDTRTGSRARISVLNPSMSEVVMGERKIVNWVGSHGEPGAGVLLLPSGYKAGNRYPLIVYVYEASLHEANRFGFGISSFFNAQLFATRGYAVFYPDLRWKKGAVLQGLADTVFPGIDSIVAMGIADEKRIGLMGHSSGGYDSLALLVQSKHRFAAAVASSGVSNMFQKFGQDLSSPISITWVTQQMRVPGNPWTNRAGFLANSPWFFLDQIETPLMILQGSKDHNAPSSEAVFVGMRELGKPVFYARYEGEDHSLLLWTKANKLDAAARLIRWFDAYLK